MKHEIKFANGRRTWAEKITPDLITELAEQFDCPVDTIDGVDSMKFMGITQGTKAKHGTITPTLRKSLNKYINEAINIKHSNIKEVAITDENLDKELRTKFGEFPMGLLIDLDGDNMFYLKFVDSINMFEVSASEFNNSHLKAKTGTKTGTQKYAVSGGGLAEDYIVEANSKDHAIEISQASLRPIFGSVPKNRFSVKIVNKVEAKKSDLTHKIYIYAETISGQGYSEPVFKVFDTHAEAKAELDINKKQWLQADYNYVESEDGKDDFELSNPDNEDTDYVRLRIFEVPGGKNRTLIEYSEPNSVYVKTFADYKNAKTEMDKRAKKEKWEDKEEVADNTDSSGTGGHAHDGYVLWKIVSENDVVNEGKRGSEIDYDYENFKIWCDEQRKKGAKLSNQRKTFMGGATTRFGPALFSISGDEPFEIIYPSDAEAEYLVKKYYNTAKVGAKTKIDLGDEKAKLGTKTGKGFVVFNYTDNIPASPDVFPTKAMANDFIAQFRKRFEAQGYYRDNQWNKIAPKDIDLLAIPEDFNTSRKK